MDIGMNNLERSSEIMKKTFSIIIPALLLLAGAPADARDTKHLLPISVAMETKDAQDKLEGSIKFFFGSQQYPKVVKKFSTDVTNRKTNAFNKTDEKACNWAFLSAMVALEKRAHELGANAVVNIVSYYQKNEMSSPTEFECHAGAVIAGVALKGDFVTIEDK
jgi:uncharacterized protein YbjQ (UPF0145 family)